MSADLLDLVRSRSGHFRLESGHHASRWLDLERLCMNVEAVESHACVLADRLARHAFDVVCGPLVEGAFVALMVARRLARPFVYAERIAPANAAGLFEVKYEIPASVRAELSGRRVAIVNDFTSAGSAVRGTVRDVRACGGVVAAIGTLVLLGTGAERFCDDEGLPLEALQRLPFEIWEPSVCPQCAAGEPLLDPQAAIASPAAANHAGGGR
jgi:orotate phosphoribosyltransferase